MFRVVVSEALLRSCVGACHGLFVASFFVGQLSGYVCLGLSSAKNLK